MRAELRADGLHINGYVNVPGRESRPVMTPHGMVIEVIEQRAFGRAIKRAKDGIRMLLDHDPARVLADTAHHTLKAYEDAVGLRAESVVTDPEVIEAARRGEIKGWSFNIRNPVDVVEQRAEGLPIRRIKDLDMDEITLVVHRVPVYSSTSVELRAGEEENVEYRMGDMDDLDFEDRTDPGEPKEPEDPKEPEETDDDDPEERSVHAEYLARIDALK